MKTEEKPRDRRGLYVVFRAPEDIDWDVVHAERTKELEAMSERAIMYLDLDRKVSGLVDF